MLIRSAASVHPGISWMVFSNVGFTMVEVFIIIVMSNIKSLEKSRDKGNNKLIAEIGQVLMI
jgi:hypothetical protein